MGIVVEFEMFALKCPVCGSRSTYHRKIRGNFRCRMCGSIFRNEAPLDTKKDSKEVIKHGTVASGRA